jgi:hypothetical protein
LVHFSTRERKVSNLFCPPDVPKSRFGQTLRRSEKNDLNWHARRCVDGLSEVGMFGAKWETMVKGGEACS